MMQLHKGIWVSVLAAVIFAFNTAAQTRLPESPIKTVYITPFSHYDFGFVEPPDAIRDRAARHIDEVIRVAEENPNFKWTIESVWQVNEWLKRQRKPSSVLPKDKEKIARLMNLIKSGRIELSAAWGSMHTDFMGAEELNRLTYDYTALSRTYGVESQLAMMNDVPGHPTSIPSVLAGSGMKYMVTGANTFIGVATSLAPGKVPFYWESPDGSKVLTWISQGNRGAYVEAVTEYYLDPFSLDPYTDRRPFEMFNPEMIGKTTPLQEMEIGMTNLFDRYNKAGYKYDAVMAMYSHDFVEPTDVLNLEKAIELWKRHHPEIELKIATPTEFFKYIEGKYGPELPTFRGEWSGLWSEAKTQSPRISAMARYSHDHVPAAETLWSAIAMTRQIPVPVGNIYSLYDLMLTYDEHSGAGNNGWPQLNSRDPLEEQNRQYVEYMQAATRGVDQLLESGIGILSQPGRHDEVRRSTNGRVRPLVVYNALSWRRSDVVKIAPIGGMRISSIRDAATGSTVGFDIDDDGNAVFVARDVPSVGYAAYEVAFEAGSPQSTLKVGAGYRIGNDNFNVEVRTDGTIKSIFDKRASRELVSEKGELPFNELLRVEGSDASRVVYPAKPKIVVRNGAHMSKITVLREDSVFPVTSITIHDGHDRVELSNELAPERFPFVGGNNNWNDSYYFAFPFDLSADGLKVMRGGQKWFDRLPDDYMPGARWDAVTTQHLLAMTDGRGTALAAHRQAFHWVYPGFVPTRIKPKDAPKELPAMFTGKFPLPEATIYSRAIRHSSQADTHDLSIYNLATVEPGLTGNIILEYAFAAGNVFDPIRAWRMGAEHNIGLRAEYAAVKPKRDRYGFFAVDAENVSIVTVKPQARSAVRGEVSSAPLNPPVNRVFVIRLQEFAGRPATVRVELPVKVRSAARVNLTESQELAKITQLEPLTVDLRPYETATIRIETE
jgi:hypothetical protein